MEVLGFKTVSSCSSLCVSWSHPNLQQCKKSLNDDSHISPAQCYLLSNRLYSPTAFLTSYRSPHPDGSSDLQYLFFLHCSVIFIQLQKPDFGGGGFFLTLSPSSPTLDWTISPLSWLGLDNLSENFVRSTSKIVSALAIYLYPHSTNIAKAAATISHLSSPLHYSPFSTQLPQWSF